MICGGLVLDLVECFQPLLDFWALIICKTQNYFDRFLFELELRDNLIGTILNLEQVFGFFDFCAEILWYLKFEKSTWGACDIFNFKRVIKN